MDAFARILLGHLLADYLLQNKEMALRKSEKTWRGFAWCLVHCLLYTGSICLFLKSWSIWTLSLVFLSHWPIDRYSLTGYWLRLIRGRDIKEALASTSIYREAEIAFACLIYAVADNTLHLILLWLFFC